MASALAYRLDWVSITPLGTPVVPLVYISSAVASAVGAAAAASAGVSFALPIRAGQSTASAAITTMAMRRSILASMPRTFASHSGLTRTTLQSLCPRTYCIWSGADTRLTGLTHQPPCMAPSSSCSVIKPLGMTSDTVSPGWLPCARNRAAVRWQPCASSPNVTRPLPTVSSA